MRVTQNLRVQLLASHMLALAVMLVVMIGPVFSFFHLGRSIDRVLADNYRSVRAAQSMKDSLAQIDTAVMLRLAGEPELAAERFAEATRQFETAHDVVAHNITEAGEQELAAQIGRSFEEYRADVEALLSTDTPTSADNIRRRYLNEIRPSSELLTDRANGVLFLNQRAMMRANERAKAGAQRASWVSVVVTVVAFVLAVLVALRMVSLALNPLLALAQQAKEIGAGRLTGRITTDRRDEIGTLADAFNRMAEERGRARAE